MRCSWPGPPTNGPAARGPRRREQLATQRALARSRVAGQAEPCPCDRLAVQGREGGGREHSRSARSQRLIYFRRAPLPGYLRPYLFRVCWPNGLRGLSNRLDLSLLLISRCVPLTARAPVIYLSACLMLIPLATAFVPPTFLLFLLYSSYYSPYLVRPSSALLRAF